VSRRAEIQVGLTVLLALVVLLWGVTWLKEFSLQRRVTVWHVRFPETGGLGASDEVRVNGIRKGAVSSIALQGDHVLVDLALASDVRLTTDSRVAIRNVGLMGEKVIAVDLRATGQPVASADTLEGIYEQGLPEIMANLGGTLSALDRTSRQLDRITRRLAENGDLDVTLSNFRQASSDLRSAVSENRALLHRTLQDAGAAASAAREMTAGNREQVARTLDTIQRSAQNVERLASRLDSLRAQAQVVTGRVENGDGTLGRLVNDRQLYDDVRTTLASLNALIADIQAHPKKYIHVSVF
jgi:phospholipid/cholesterol/gamma-HCH transport system substrate-binding protein